MQKKVPLRLCLGCREMKPKKELIRVVKSPAGEISFDPVGKKPGRGAYVCKDEICFKKIIKSNALARAFKVQIPESTMDEMQNQLITKEVFNGS